ncbi:MAG TPA: hypothetical protein VD816_12665, partial [Ohtaekwangia sp.]|nr:hypothetical protein [Ohtaekwangia sp.]
YYLAVLLPVLLTALAMRFFVSPRFPVGRPVMSLILWVVIFTIPLYAASVIHPNFYPERFLEVIVSNYESFIEISDPGDAIVYENLQPDAGHILWHTPKALLSGLFRPLLWESQNGLQLVIAMENTVLLICFIAAMASWKYVFRSTYRVLIFSAIVYIFLLCVFLALSTPNFGTLVRYRVGFLPFFILLILIKNPLTRRLGAFIERTFFHIGR